MYHSLDICYDIAQKLKDPEKVSLLMKEQIKRGPLFANEWLEFSLAWGLPGIVYFYATMHANFANEGWDNVINDYFQYIQRQPVKDLNVSLFGGVAGLSFAVYVCSDNGKRYATTLSKLDDTLIREVRNQYLDREAHHSNPQKLVPSYYYNLANGFSGIIAYLLLRDDLRDLTEQCVYSLVKTLSKRRTVNSEEVFPWLVNPQSLDYIDTNQACKSGFYPLQVNYGIAGVLGVLSKAALKGIKVDGLYELIQILAQWIKSKQQIKNGLVYWDVVSPKESAAEIQEDSGGHGYDWKIGTLGICRCLDLASEALQDWALAQDSEGIFLSNLQAFPSWPKSIDTSLSIGKAGLLSTVYRMGRGKENPLYWKIARELEENLKKNYDPSFPFGFQVMDFDAKNKTEWTDAPGLLHGAAGIGLSLLEVQGRVELPWSQMFVIL